MAVEARRGCGFRQVGGTYLVGSGLDIACDRLPIPLEICPCCGQGIKQARGWTWIDLPKLVGGPHFISALDLTPIKGPAGIEIPNVTGKKVPCKCFPFCPLCKQPDIIGRAGLIWIGGQFYPTIDHFETEARSMGVSRRIAAIPRGFEVGKTWVLFAHAKGIVKPADDGMGTKWVPAIFRVWKPEAIERIYNESDRGSEKVAKDEEKGIRPVFVPDNDPDHHGQEQEREGTDQNDSPALPL